MPLYVSALYTFEEEYQKMSDKIVHAKNSSEEKIELQKELLAAKQQLEKANGVPEIIRKYVTNYNGKYLVFCKDKKHLYAMKDVVISWFREAGYKGKIFEYPYYSNSSEVKKNLDKFENDKEEGLKLLFIIDKLNEGLHLEEVHGCILLRTTVSNIIYYQQIGRAIDAGSNEQRVILDLVSNFNSLKSFNLKKELEEKVRERKEGKFSDCPEEFDIGKFDVVDCVQECVDVFNGIDERIISVYEYWTTAEENLLKENWIKGREYVQNIFPNRVWGSIKGKASHLGLIDGNLNWTIEEDNMFKELYSQYGTASYDMMPNRNRNACILRRQRLKLRKTKNNDRDIFTEEYDKIIKEKYPELGGKCCIYMDNVTERQVISRAGKLGICKNKTSNYRYVSCNNRKRKYAVQFVSDGENLFFGYFDSEEEAGKVALEKAKEYGKIK